MTDLIARLAERTLGVASVIQPLVTSRFAPGPPIVGEALSDFLPATEIGDDGAMWSLTDRGTLVESSQPVPTLPSVPVSQQTQPSATPMSLPRETPDTGPLPDHRVALNGIEETEKLPSSVAPTPPAEVEDTPGRSEWETLTESSQPVPTPPLVLVSQEAQPSATPMSPLRETSDAVPPSERHIESEIDGPATWSPLVAPKPHGAVLGTESRPGHRVEPDVEGEGQRPALPALQGSRSVTTPTALQPPVSHTRSAASRRVESETTETVEAKPIQATGGSEGRGTFARIPRLVRSEHSSAEDRSMENLPITWEPLVEQVRGPSPSPEPLPEIYGDASRSRRAPKTSSPERRPVSDVQPSAVLSQLSSVPGAVRPNIAAQREPERPTQAAREVVLPAAQPSATFLRQSSAPRTIRPDTAARQAPVRPTQEGHKAVPSELESGATFRQKPSVPTVIRPQVVARREPARSSLETQQAALEEAPSLPPTIRVTIGRVEVRATTPPAPPMPRTPPVRRGPALSLDDYLQQRDEGG